MGSETHAQPGEVATLMGNGAAAVEAETEKSRRALLKGLGVAAAGAVVVGVLSPEEAEAHGTFHADSNNGTPAIHGHNSGLVGSGVLGTSIGGPGLHGFSNSGPGVEASSATGVGVEGSSESLIGVEGTSPNGIGVEGFSENGIGVDGNGGNVGVVASSESGTALFAGTTDGLALDVHGPVRFSTAGAGVIPAQQNSVAVSDPAVTADSHITMTYTGNPGLTGSGTFAAVVWIERQPGTGFTARLSRRVTNATPFTYLIVEPG